MNYDQSRDGSAAAEVVLPRTGTWLASTRWPNLFGTSHQGRASLKVSPAEREILRGLAAEVAVLAARPIEAEKHDLWYRLNRLEATRPLVFCDPDNAWNEIIPPADLRCQGDLARHWETMLRREVYWATQIRDDRVIQATFDVPYTYTDNWGLGLTRVGGGDGGSFVVPDPPLKDYTVDLPRLRPPELLVEYDATHQMLDLARDVLGDLLPVRLKDKWWSTLGLGLILGYLRGLQQVMLDMIDNPDGLHAIMGFLRDAHLARLDLLEAKGLLSLNSDDTYVGSGGFGWSDELPQRDFSGRVRTQDMWGFAESQQTVGVSPSMFAEFVFPYQLPILERFGLNCYGCCEPLDRRWHIVEQIPRLRRVSVSPWSDVPTMAEKLGDRYIFSWKPHPSDLCVEHFNEEGVRQYVRGALRATRQCRVEVIMKDTHTIGRDPRRVIRWVEIVRQEIEAL